MTTAQRDGQEEERRARPILSSGEMVRAILDGRKTQTRRVVKPQPELAVMDHRSREAFDACRDTGVIPGNASDPRWQWRGTFMMPWPSAALVLCPYARRRGDRLWVREGFYIDLCPHDRGALPSSAPADEWAEHIYYRADGECCEQIPECQCGSPEVGPPRWRPSIHMPRWASRITLEITGVRVERVQDISAEDAEAEGYPPLGPHGLTESGRRLLPPRAWFTRLWTEINGPRGYGWDANPWVWAISFRRPSPDPQ